jgi:hypothetical protein
VTRFRFRRAVVTASSTALLAALLFGGTSLGANTRVIYLGSPDGTGGGFNTDGSLIFGTLTNTAVTVGGKTATVLLVRNDGGQTLNHVKIAGGALADGKPYNPRFPQPSGSSLPANASFAAVLPQTTGITCDPSSGASFECSLGTLAAGASASFLIVITPPATAGDYGYWFTGSWNEGWSSTGTNADYQFATGTIHLKAGSCSGGTSSYFLSGESVGLNDGSTDQCQSQDASVASGDTLTGNGGFASLLIDTTYGATCPTGYKCYGKTVSASILGGVAVPGGVQWTVTWYGTKSMGGVIHFLDTYDASDPDHKNDFKAIPFTKALKCSATLTSNCWVSVTASKGNANPLTFTAVFITPNNGKGGGFL